MELPTITLEEHYASSCIVDQPDVRKTFETFPDTISTRLADLTPNGPRLTQMDSGKVSLQVVSHSPGASSSAPALCRQANDELAAATAKRPDRLAAFACLPMAHPEEAAKELERCIHEHGFVGALIDNHLTDGTYYDSPRFWAVFEKAQALDAPIYLHPTFPTAAMKSMLYDGEYSAGVAGSLGTSGLGWHTDTALHVLRLFGAGLFDRFPQLKLIVGHMGEMLPFQLERIESFVGQRWARTQDVKTLRRVWDENLWITTSGMFSVNPMACMLRNTKIERILYSVDWPFAENEAGWQFLKELGESGLVDREQLEMIAYKNAEVLLKVKAKA